MDQQYIDDIRFFNRHYTSVLGVLNKHFLNSEFSLPEGRVLFELFHKKNISSRQLIEILQIDKGYLSRILKKFKLHHLISSSPSDNDARFQHLQLSEKGEEAYQRLNTATDQQIREIFCKVPEEKAIELINSMNNIISIMRTYC
jgi:DNA-binding MarR family transcriptional regulator